MPQALQSHNFRLSFPPVSDLTVEIEQVLFELSISDSLQDDRNSPVSPHRHRSPYNRRKTLHFDPTITSNPPKPSNTPADNTRRPSWTSRNPLRCPNPPRQHLPLLLARGGQLPPHNPQSRPFLPTFTSRYHAKLLSRRWSGQGDNKCIPNLPRQRMVEQRTPLRLRSRFIEYRSPTERGERVLYAARRFQSDIFPQESDDLDGVVFGGDDFRDALSDGQ